MAPIEGKITMTTCEGRPCWVRGRRAIFHRWTDSARPVKPVSGDQDTDERLQKWSVHGLVEYEDGRMEREWPNNIRFADSRERFNGLAWEEMEARRDALPFTFGEELDTSRPPAEKACYTCAHEDDGETADCEAATYGCKACPAWDCYCSGCTEYSKWTPKEGAVCG